MLDGFKSSDAVGTSICRGSADDMFINQNIDVCLPSLAAVGIFGLRTAFYSNLMFSIIFVYRKSISGST